MKIKFSQANQNQPNPGVPHKQPRTKLAGATTCRGPREFGRDITSHQNRPTYDYVAPDQCDIRIPSFLKSQPTVDPLTQPYEEEIMRYVVEWHGFYDMRTSTRLKEKRFLARRFKVLKPLYKTYLKWGLRRKTWELCVYYFDRWAEAKWEKKVDELVVAANTCMLMAMKHEEIYPPACRDWCEIPLRMLTPVEWSIMEALEFRFNLATPQDYLNFYASHSQQDGEGQRLHRIVLDLFELTGACH